MGAACSLPTPEMPAHLSSAHVWWAPGPFCPRRASGVQRGAGRSTCWCARTREGAPQLRWLGLAIPAGEARPDAGDAGQSPRPGATDGLCGPAFYGLQLLLFGGGGLPNSPRPAGCSTVADPQLYEPKCLSSNRSEEVVCDKKIICQNCNNKEGLVGSLTV